MKKILFIVLGLFSTLAFSQNLGHIEGKILDEEMNGEPLFFAEVRLENSDYGTQTNFHGNFEISGISPGTYTLVVSYLGYENLELPVQVDGNQVTYIQKGLHAHRISMDEVIRYNDNSDQDNSTLAGPGNPIIRYRPAQLTGTE